MRGLVGLISGVIFGLGLVVSGMSDPAKVLNFLDFAGTWDPSLAFVMGGGILVTAPGYFLLFKRPKPVLAATFDVPKGEKPDRRLLVGAAIFGLGWGLGGFCPGPMVTAMPLAHPGTLVFAPLMLLGLWLGRRV